MQQLPLSDLISLADTNALLLQPKNEFFPIRIFFDTQILICICLFAYHINSFIIHDIHILTDVDQFISSTKAPLGVIQLAIETKYSSNFYFDKTKRFIETYLCIYISEN